MGSNVNDDEAVPVPTQNAPLHDLTQRLLEAQAQEVQHHKGAHDDAGVWAGLSAGSLMVGLVLSTAGIGMIRYARVTLQWMWAIVGVLLMTIPFVITNVWILTGVGVGLIGSAWVAKRFISF